MRPSLCRAAAFLVATTLCAGCGLSREQPIFLHVSSYALYGQVLRSGEPLPRQTVKLYEDAGSLDTEGAFIDSVVTDASGQYGFTAAPAGGMMVKVTSLRSGDFRYVRYIFTRSTAGERDSIPPLDVFAYGCHMISPADRASLPQPSPSAPLDFSWTPMSGFDLARYRVRIDDATGTLVWESSRDILTQASFNGLGTNAQYAGTFIPPGTFTWRIKVHLPNDVSAATEERLITFTAAGGNSP